MGLDHKRALLRRESRTDHDAAVCVDEALKAALRMALIRGLQLACEPGPAEEPHRLLDMSDAV